MTRNLRNRVCFYRITDKEFSDIKKMIFGLNRFIRKLKFLKIKSLEHNNAKLIIFPFCNNQNKLI